MRLLRFFIGLLLALTIHSLLHNFFPNALAFIDVYIILVVYYAMGGNLNGTIIAAVIAGFVQDAFSGSIFGLHAFSLTLSGYLVAVVATKIVLRGAPSFLGAVAGAIVVNELVIFLLVNIFQHQRIELDGQQMILKTVISSLLAALIYQLVIVLGGREPQRRGVRVR
ncbi:MAG: rod shape-determining protein MreD [Thermoanaerobaculia bacterium]|nr:rod shape-determining protein MreD [Thermoanaerobaculia bacterium]